MYRAYRFCQKHELSFDRDNYPLEPDILLKLLHLSSKCKFASAVLCETIWFSNKSTITAEVFSAVFSLPKRVRSACFQAIEDIGCTFLQYWIIACIDAPAESFWHVFCDIVEDNYYTKEDMELLLAIGHPTKALLEVSIELAMSEQISSSNCSRISDNTKLTTAMEFLHNMPDEKRTGDG